MASDLGRRVTRIELREDADELHRLRRTERPSNLPDTPAAEWGEADLARLAESVVAAQAAGARRPLGWMSTPDLLALHARCVAMKGAGHA